MSAPSLRFNIFTLIELLVVIAIIAIIASMLFPALNAARAKARSAGCISQQKQIMLAVKMYNNDYNDYYPTHSFPVSGISDGILLNQMKTYDGRLELCGYVKVNTGLFSCPAADPIHTSPGWAGSNYDWRLGKDGNGVPITIGIEIRLGHNIYGADAAVTTPRRSNDFRIPSIVTILGDTKTCKPDGTKIADEVYYRGNTHLRKYGTTGYLDFRHSPAANTAMADGHTQPFRSYDEFEAKTVSPGY